MNVDAGTFQHVRVYIYMHLLPVSSAVSENSESPTCSVGSAGFPEIGMELCCTRLEL